MPKELRILMLEDVESHAKLITYELRKMERPFVSKRVDTKESFLKEIDDFKPDIILSDYDLPQFTGMSAFRMLKEKGIEIPFIIVTGALSDEAVDYMKEGIDDYILKSAIKRLPYAVVSALEKWEYKLEREKALASLRESEKRYRRITEAATDYIYTVTIENGRPVKTVHGPACAAVTGYASEELAGDPYLWINMVAEEDRSAVREMAEKILSGRDSPPLEHRIIRKDGSIRWVRNTPVAHFDRQGDVISYDGLIQDITERKDAEERLRKHKENLEKLVKERTAELTTERDMARKSEEALRKSMEETEHRTREVSALLEASRSVLKYGDFATAAREIFESCHNLIGAPGGYVGLMSRDGKLNELIFLESGGLPCDVDVNLPMPIRGMRGEAYFKNKTIYHNDFPATEWVKLIPEGHVPLENAMFAPLIVGGKTLGVLGIANKPGGFNEDDARMATAFAELAAISLNNSRNMEELARSEERFHKLVETANDAIISIDSRDIVVSWNHGAEKIFGYTSDERIGSPLAGIMPERYREAHSKGLKAYLETGKAKVIGKTLELAGLRKDGTEFPLELSLTAWDTREGKFFTGIIRDITERKRSEEKIEKLNEELNRRAEDLESANKELESFSYSVSHDLRVPLRAIDGFAEILQEDYGDRLDKEGKRLLNVVRSNAETMQRLIDDLLAFSRMGRKELMESLLDMKELASDVIRELKSMETQRSIRFNVSDLPSAYGDRAMIRLVYSNLIANAIKFTRPVKDSAIEVGGSVQESENIYFVRDNGVGFDMDQAGQMFGVFQRFHPSSEFEGTGVGLAIVQRIINRHGGRVWAEGKVEKGATFYFSLPRNLHH